MKKMTEFLSVLMVGILLVSCEIEDGYSTDIFDDSLLPDTEDYLRKDYKTQALAKELKDAFSVPANDTCNIQLVIYNNETRTKPTLTFTGTDWPIKITPLENGAIEFGYEHFKTAAMPLKMTTKVKVLLKLSATKDTIYLNGTDGSVRTIADDSQPIGTPLPESDDAELEGFYVRSNKKLYILFDLMLPIAVKAHIRSKN